MGGQASWLLPAALLALVGGLWATRRAPRTDRTRAALLLWGGWLLVTAAVFSFAGRDPHLLHGRARAGDRRARRDRRPTALAAARRARARARRRRGRRRSPRGWSYALLERTPSWQPWLRPLIAVRGGRWPSSALLAASRAWPGAARAARRRGGCCGVLACLAGPVAYTIADDQHRAHRLDPLGRPGDVSAAPAAAGGGPGGGSAAARSRRLGGGGTSQRPAGHPARAAPGRRRSGRRVRGGVARTAAPAVGGAARGGGGGAGGQHEPSAARSSRRSRPTRRLPLGRGHVGLADRRVLELASGGEPVMAIGGFNGNGGNLSLAQFEPLRARGEIHYYIASAGGGAGGGPGG